MIPEFIQIYSRDLDRLIAEVKAFRMESYLWLTKGAITNSAGNLSLHLVGNLKTYIGKNMGNHEFVRDREAEFSLKNIPTERLLDHLEETKAIVLKSLSQMEAEDLVALHPEDVLRYPMSNSFFLLHLAAHLSYHLGQINYLRRVLEE